MPRSRDYYLSDKRLWVSRSIRTHMAEQSWQKLTGSLSHGYEALPRTAHYRRLLRDGYLSLGEYYSAREYPVDAIHAFDRARQMAPRNWALIERVLSVLESLVQEGLDNGVKRDADLLRGSLSILRLIYREGKYSERVGDWIGQIESILDELEPTLRDGVESPATWVVEKIFLNQFEDLTQEQRDELRSDIFAGVLIKMLIEKEKEKDEDTESESGKE